MTVDKITPARFIRTLVDKMKVGRSHYVSPKLNPNLPLFLQIKCENHDLGCTAVVAVENLAGHVQQCSFRKTVCPNAGCSKRMMECDIEGHRQV